MIKKEKKILENDIQNDIFKYLEQEQFFFWRSNNVPVFGKNNAGKYMYRRLPKHTPRGLPDIIVLWKGKFIAIEVKREGMKLRPEQAELGYKIVANGGIYHTVHSLDELKQLFPFRLSVR